RKPLRSPFSWKRSSPLCRKLSIMPYLGCIVRLYALQVKQETDRGRELTDSCLGDCNRFNVTIERALSFQPSFRCTNTTPSVIFFWQVISCHPTAYAIA